jgi:hypothetical protein
LCNWLGHLKTKKREEFGRKNVTEGGHLEDLETIGGKIKILRK